MMQTIHLNMGEVEQLYQQCADLSEVVKPIKDVSRKHQQVRGVAVGSLQNDAIEPPQIIIKWSLADSRSDGTHLPSHT